MQAVAALQATTVPQEVYFEGRFLGPVYKGLQPSAIAPYLPILGALIDEEIDQQLPGQSGEIDIIQFTNRLCHRLHFRFLVSYMLFVCELVNTHTHTRSLSEGGVISGGDEVIGTPCKDLFILFTTCPFFQSLPRMSSKHNTHTHAHTKHPRM